MATTIIFTEGFDKYGPPTTYNTGQSNTLCATQFVNASKGIWTATSTAGFAFIGPRLANTGTGAWTVTGGANSGGTMNATMPSNLNKIVGGCYLQVNTLRASNADLRNIIFFDGAQQKAAFGIDTTGHIFIQNAAGTTIATSVGTITVGTAFLLEWEITCTTTGAYNVYKDGALILNGTSNFVSVGNTFWSLLNLRCFGSASQANHDMSFDHLYIADGSSVPLLAQTVIETDFPVSDSAVQFASGAYALGFQNSNGTSQAAPGANTMYLRKITIPTGGGGTMQSVTIIPQATSAGANNKGLIYADSAGLPGALLSGGNQVTGTTASATLTLPLTTPQVVVAGTSYWIGYMTDTSVAVFQSATPVTSSGWEKTNTYASGPPNPAGAGTSVTFSELVLWGNITGVTTNWLEAAGQVSFGAWGDFSYVFDSTVTHEDLYGINALAITPSTIYTVNVFGFIKDAAAGARTVTINTKSGGTDSAGTNAGFTPGTSYGWFNSFYAVDPNTSAAWSASNLNAATSGAKITA